MRRFLLGIAVFLGLLALPAATPAIHAAENELVIALSGTACGPVVTVTWNDVVEQEPVDKTLRIWVNDGDPAVHQLSDAIGVDDDESFDVPVAPGDTVRATLRTGPGAEGLLDTDTLAVPDADCDLGSITYTLDTKGNTDGRDFDFAFNPGQDFDLVDNESVTRSNLIDDDYHLILEDDEDWYISDFDCTGDDASDVPDWDANSADIELNNHEDLRCDIELRRRPEATATPSPTATPVPPAPTATPVQYSCQLGNITIPVSSINDCPQPTAVPTQAAPVVVTVVVPSGPITPPSTGNGGLLPKSEPVVMNGWGDDSDGGGCYYYWVWTGYWWLWLRNC